jgi:hypothetical protein
VDALSRTLPGPSDRDLSLTIVVRPPCAALPFTLEIVKFRLSPSTEKQAHQQQLDYYNRIMALFEAQHEYTECVTTAVDTVLHVAEPEINSLAIARYLSGVRPI